MSSSTAWRGASAGVTQATDRVSVGLPFEISYGYLGREECDQRFDAAILAQASRTYMRCRLLMLLPTRPDGQRECHSRDHEFTSDSI